MVLGSKGLHSAAECDTRTLTLQHTHRDDEHHGHLQAQRALRRRWPEEAQLPSCATGAPTTSPSWTRNCSTRSGKCVHELGPDKVVHIVSSYRSPKTNAMLVSRSSGVARHSLHMQGKAMDFFIPGVPLDKLREAGMRLQRGGVGFYPTSGSPFVHIDVGNVRHVAAHDARAARPGVPGWPHRASADRRPSACRLCDGAGRSRKAEIVAVDLRSPHELPPTTRESPPIRSQSSSASSRRPMRTRRRRRRLRLRRRLRPLHRADVTISLLDCCRQTRNLRPKLNPFRRPLPQHRPSRLPSPRSRFRSLGRSVPMRRSQPRNRRKPFPQAAPTRSPAFRHPISSPPAAIGAVCPTRRLTISQTVRSLPRIRLPGPSAHSPRLPDMAKASRARPLLPTRRRRSRKSSSARKPAPPRCRARPPLQPIPRLLPRRGRMPRPKCNRRRRFPRHVNGNLSRLEGPWVRAMIMTPSVERFMNTTLYGIQDYRSLQSAVDRHRQKPC